MNDKKNLDELKTEDTDKTIPKDTEIKWESNTTLKDNVEENNYMYNDPTVPTIEEEVVKETPPIKIKEVVPLAKGEIIEAIPTVTNPKKTKTTNILLITLFLFLLLFVIFLPQITNFFRTFSKNMEINSLKKPDSSPKPTVSANPLVRGTMTCHQKKQEENNKKETTKLMFLK